MSKERKKEGDTDTLWLWRGKEKEEKANDKWKNPKKVDFFWF